MAQLKALQENVNLVCLPAHTSHAFQPLDVTVFNSFKGHWDRILKFYRETKMKTVDKAIFPSLIKKLWVKISSDNLTSGFLGAGLWLLNGDAVHKERSMDSETEQCGATLNEENINLPKKLLRESIINVIVPPIIKNFRSNIDNSKRKLKRVQAKTEEQLTTPEVLEWLENEHKDREKKKKKPSSNKHDTSLRGNKIIAEDGKCESDNNEI